MWIVYHAIYINKVLLITIVGMAPRINQIYFQLLLSFSDFSK